MYLKDLLLGYYLFNAYICDIFYDIDDLDYASSADGNTPCSCLPNISDRGML